MATEQMHEAFRQAVRMEIETEREFNCFLRPVTILTDGQTENVYFDSALMQKRAPGGVELPIEFAVSIKAVKRSRFASESQNELMLRLLSMGAIDREQAIELMVFEGKDQVLKHIRETEPAEEALFPPRKQKTKWFGGIA